MNFKVPFVNVPEHYSRLRKEVLEVIDNVLSRGDLILRKDVEDFEKNLASFVGVKYSIGLNSGTDALFLALKVAGIGPGDEVITVAHTFAASVAVIVNCGAKPILVDVREDFLMDVDKIEPLINQKTKAIMPVHLNGRVCDMEKLMALAKKHNIVIIEDAAQAMGAKFGGKTAGSFGLTGCFSFYPFKLLGAFGDAGGLTTNDINVFEKIRLLRDHGQKTKTEIVCYGWNSRLDNLQAAILNIKFKYLPDWIKRRQEIADLYNKGLLDIQEVKLPPTPDEKHFDIYQNYVLKVQKRDELFGFLKEKGVETLIKDPIALHHQKGLGLLHFQLPYTEQLAKEVISLPMYPELKNEQVEYVINSVKEFYLPR